MPPSASGLIFTINGSVFRYGLFINALISFLLVAVDVLGGRFAVNDGGLPGAIGEVCYWGPDTLGWGPLGLRHGEFVQWALGGGMAELETQLRWPGWELETQDIPPGHAIATYPYLCTRDGWDVATTARRPVPLPALMALQVDLARGLAHQGA